MRMASDGISLAVVGATGAVGREALRVLSASDIPVRHLGLFASARSQGEELSVRVQKGDTSWREEYLISELTDKSFSGFKYDYAIFSIGSEQSRHFAPRAADTGCVVIDNSSAFRLWDDVPLVVPPVNAHALENHRGIISNPNCTTAIVMTALAPLHRTFGLRSISGATYQAVSGAGKKALEQLDGEMHVRYSTRNLDLKVEQVLPHPISFNVFPHVETFTENGYTKEEMKMGLEGAKILGLKYLPASITCVRVPVRRAHSIDLTVAFAIPVTPEQARAVLADADGVRIVDNPTHGEYPMPLTATGKREVEIGRIRRDLVHEDALKLFICGDQLLRGAALNAVEILEELLKLGRS